jgi:DNA-directed RNA polymerase subunit RPC12/RpoP
MTHLMEALIFWWPAYRLAGVMKFLTAAVSWLTVVALIRVAPAACPECGSRELIDEGTQPQWQTDLPRGPVIRKFDIHHGHCTDCGRRVQGRYELPTSEAFCRRARRSGETGQRPVSWGPMLTRRSRS